MFKKGAITNLNKSDYRFCFTEVNKYLKMSKILKECKVSLSNYSKFCKYDHCSDLLSLEKCDLILMYINKYLNQMHFTINAD